MAKPSATWKWKGIISCQGILLTQPRWQIGSGKEIDLNNANQFHPKLQILSRVSNKQMHTVNDLIIPDLGSWNIGLVKKQYHSGDAPNFLNQCFSNFGFPSTRILPFCIIVIG